MGCPTWPEVWGNCNHPFRKIRHLRRFPTGWNHPILWTSSRGPHVHQPFWRWLPFLRFARKAILEVQIHSHMGVSLLTHFGGLKGTTGKPPAFQVVGFRLVCLKPPQKGFQVEKGKPNPLVLWCADLLCPLKPTLMWHLVHS